MTDIQLANMVKMYQISLTEAGEIRFCVAGTKAEQEATRDELLSHKAEIVEYLQGIKKAANERQAKIDAIDGLSYLYDIAGQWERFYADRNKAFETECVDAFYPKKPSETMSEANARYPRAAAYRLVLEWSNSENYHKAIAGRTALERIIDGENHERVIKEMEDEWGQAAARNMWD